jgi:hypothetical protein
LISVDKTTDKSGRKFTNVVTEIFGNYQILSRETISSFKPGNI